jgi:NAD(P)-dependent dehydrogenase (short-subunit alcohol dehydrogenase family)
MSDPFDFAGQTVLVTGGSRGLGRAMAMGFAARGANLIVASRNILACSEVVDAVCELGGNGRALEFDAADWRCMDDFVERAWGEFGQIDVLINNAGMAQRPGSSIDLIEEAFDALMSVNCKGAFRLSALVGSRMVRQGKGSIMNISSLGAIRPAPAYAVYAAAKAALNAITTAHALEFAPQVRVNAILPGAFETDMAADWSDEAKVKIGAALGRNGQPQDIVTTALYLASNASSYTTGAMIRVDGGRT